MNKMEMYKVCVYMLLFSRQCPRQAPLSMDVSGKNTSGMGYFLLQESPQTCGPSVPCIAGGFFTTEPLGKPVCVYTIKTYTHTVEAAGIKETTSA